MSIYKDGRWAKEIISQQQSDGSWGEFHSLSLPVSGKKITTEQAVGRLLLLGYTKEDEVIEKALSYMHDCLASVKRIPDRIEKRMDWQIFVDLMLAVWIRRFNKEDVLANEVAHKWRIIVEEAFATGEFDQDRYIKKLYEVLVPSYGTVKRTKELLRLDYYYPVSILVGEIDKKIEKPYFDYVMDSKTGYYYGYIGAVTKLPDSFTSREASRFLSAVEIYCEYNNQYCREKLKVVKEWLVENRNAEGLWDMGTEVKDNKYFPLSDSWRTKELRQIDCSNRIQKILSSI